jgi:hypothetical protein
LAAGHAAVDPELTPPTREFAGSVAVVNAASLEKIFRFDTNIFAASVRQIEGYSDSPFWWLLSTDDFTTTPIQMTRPNQP